MFSKTVTVINQTGLHARPASELVAKAKSFASDITIKKVGSDMPAVNAKSMLRLLSAGITQGTEIEISAAGEDETVAVEALVSLIQSGFGE